MNFCLILLITIQTVVAFRTVFSSRFLDRHRLDDSPSAFRDKNQSTGTYTNRCNAALWIFPKNALSDGLAFWIFPQDSRIRVQNLFRQYLKERFSMQCSEDLIQTNCMMHPSITLIWATFGPMLPKTWITMKTILYIRIDIKNVFTEDSSAINKKVLSLIEVHDVDDKYLEYMLMTSL